jgi:hypothetical protein
MVARVARKLFATIRYRFSHLDNGLTWKLAYGQVAQCREIAQVIENKVVSNGPKAAAGYLGPGSSGRLIAFCMVDREVGVGVLWR